MPWESLEKKIYSKLNWGKIVPCQEKQKCWYCGIEIQVCLRWLFGLEGRNLKNDKQSPRVGRVSKWFGEEPRRGERLEKHRAKAARDSIKADHCRNKSALKDRRSRREREITWITDEQTHGKCHSMKNMGKQPQGIRGARGTRKHWPAAWPLFLTLFFLPKIFLLSRN